MSSSPLRMAKLLLLDDSPSDVELTRELLNDGKIYADLDVVADGVAAIDYLKRVPPYQSAPRPDLVFLDLNLPRKDGHQVLAEIKADAALCDIPVVMLATPGAEEDIARGHAPRADAYVRKPIDAEQLSRVVRALDPFWFTIVKRT